MKWMLFGFLGLVCFGFDSKPNRPRNCDSLRVVAETKESFNGSNGEISLTASGGQAPYRYVVYKSSGHLISSEDFSQNKFTNLKKDIYQAIVVDEKGCKTQLEIQLK